MPDSSFPPNGLAPALGYDLSLLLEAVARDDTAAAQRYAHRAAPVLPLNHFSIAVHTAAAEGSSGVLRWLLESSHRPTGWALEPLGISCLPLKQAAYRGDAACVELLCGEVDPLDTVNWLLGRWRGSFDARAEETELYCRHTLAGLVSGLPRPQLARFTQAVERETPRWPVTHSGLSDLLDRAAARERAFALGERLGGPPLTAPPESRKATKRRF